VVGTASSTVTASKSGFRIRIMGVTCSLELGRAMGVVLRNLDIEEVKVMVEGDGDVKGRTGCNNMSSGRSCGGTCGKGDVTVGGDGRDRTADDDVSADVGDNAEDDGCAGGGAGGCDVNVGMGRAGGNGRGAGGGFLPTGTRMTTSSFFSSA